MYAVLIERETTWEHILALEAVLLKYGFPLAYYVDSHSIFRFVQGRDSFWRNHYKLTDEANPQWKQVLDDCGVKVTYALSPQAKGKIERPYRWLLCHRPQSQAKFHSKPYPPRHPRGLPPSLEDRRIISDNEDYSRGKASLPLDRAPDKRSFCDLFFSLSPGEDPGI